MNRIEDYARSIHSALIKDLLDIDVPDSKWGPAFSRRPSEDEIAVFAREEVWSDTSLAFNLRRGGLAGQAFTKALTVIVTCGTENSVYVGGSHAYTVRSRDNAHAIEVLGMLARSSRLPDQRGAVTLFPSVWIGGREITPEVLTAMDAEYKQAERDYMKKMERVQREAAKEALRKNRGVLAALGSDAETTTNPQPAPKRPILMLGQGQTIPLNDPEEGDEN